MKRGWSLTSAELPLQIRRIHPRAPRPTARVTEANHTHQWTLLLFGRSHKAPIDSIQHQLGATKHLEASVVLQIAPRQVEEAIASLAVNCRASEVHRRVASCDDSDIEFPACGHRVAWDEIVWFLPNLNPDANVVERMAIRITERTSWKINTVDHNLHLITLPFLASRYYCVGRAASLGCRPTAIVETFRPAMNTNTGGQSTVVGQLAVHDMQANTPECWVPERTRHGADDIEPEPAVHGKQLYLRRQPH